MGIELANNNSAYFEVHIDTIVSMLLVILDL